MNCLLKISPALVALAVLGGCTSIDYRAGPVPGLEQLAVEEHHVDAGEIYARCSTCGDLGPTLPNACTCINFRTRRAVIWLAKGASPETIEHERAHARGYDHHGGELKRQFTAWAKSPSRHATEVPDQPVYQANVQSSSPAN